MIIFSLIFTISFLGFGNNVPQNREAVDESDTDATLAKHKQEHYNDYLLKTKNYETWPELDPDNAVAVCKQYILKMCSRVYVHVTYATLEFIHIQYFRMGTHKRRYIKILALRCEPIPSIFRQKVLHFVRSPDTRCVYLTQSVNKKGKNYVIALQICESHTYKQLKNNLEGIYKGSSSHQARADDNPTKIANSEREHLQAFLSNSVLYKTWPELENDTIMKKYCKVFLKQIFPKTPLDFIPFLKLTLLHYVSFNLGHDTKVSALLCNSSKSLFRNSQQFIRAPSSGSKPCVFLIRTITGGCEHNQRCTNLTKKLCANEDDGIFSDQEEIIVFVDIDNMIIEGQRIDEQHSVEGIQNVMNQQLDNNHDDIFVDLDSIISDDFLNLPLDG